MLQYQVYTTPAELPSRGGDSTMGKSKTRSKNKTAHTTMITVRLPHTLHSQIRDYTTLTGASRSALLCEGVKLAMQRNMETDQRAVGIK